MIKRLFELTVSMSTFYFTFFFLYREEISSELKMVLEVGSLDLAQVLKNSRNRKIPLSHFTIQHYWHEMLLAVQEIHKEG